MKQGHRQEGFTLIEIMIALLVFSVIMLGVAGGLIAAIRTNKTNVVRDEALRIAEDELNRLRGEPFTIATTSANLAATAWTTPLKVSNKMRSGTIDFFQARQVTDLGTLATTLKRIDVAVGWNDPGDPGGALLPATNKNRQVSVSTIIMRSE